MDEMEKSQQRGGKSSDEVALDLMKFIASETGYGKPQGSVGFAGKNAKSPEEQVDAVLALFDRCRKSVRQEPAA
jgi:hypothetical protein